MSNLTEILKDARCDMVKCREAAAKIRSNLSENDVLFDSVNFDSHKTFKLPLVSHNISFSINKNDPLYFELCYGHLSLDKVRASHLWLIHLCKLKTDIEAKTTISKRKIFLDKILRRLIGVKLVIDEIVARVLWEEFGHTTLCLYNKKASYQLKEEIDRYHCTPHGKLIRVQFDLLDHARQNPFHTGPFLEFNAAKETHLQYNYLRDRFEFNNEMKKVKMNCEAANFYLYRKLYSEGPTTFPPGHSVVKSFFICHNPRALAMVCEMINYTHEPPSCPLFSRVTIKQFDKNLKTVRKLANFSEEECRLFYNNYQCYVLPDIANGEKNSSWIMANTIDASLDTSCTGIEGKQCLQFEFETAWRDDYFRIDIFAAGVEILNAGFF